MTVEQAFATLGIPVDSDESAISKAYHELSQLYHPDKPDGDANRQADINEAHETLMAEVSQNRALVVIRNTQALHEVKALILSEQAARNAAKEVFAAKRRGVGPLHRMKTAAWVAGSVAAIATFIPDKVLPIMPKDEADIFKPVLGMTALMAGLIGAFFQFRATQLASHIDEFSDEMDDPRNCAQALASTLLYKDAPVIAESDIRPYDVRRRPRNPVEMLENLFLPRFSYQVEHERLIQLKAIQHGLITAIPVNVVTPDSVPTFKVNFQPSSFRPKPADTPSPPKPMPIGEAKGMAIFGGVGTFGLGGLAVYLGAIQHTWWAALPAFFGFGLATVFAEGISSWRKAPTDSGLPETASHEPPQETGPS